MSEALAQPGEVIGGRYRVGALLGEGGMGAVYEAFQTQLNRPVAIKLLHPEIGAQQEARARFEREARVTAALRHPHTVEIYDFGEDAGRLFLVMERLEGAPLSRVMRGGLLPLARTLEIVRQVADALVAAHALPLIHRDLKPENLFIERDDRGHDRAVVVDFGLGFIAEREDADRLTSADVIMGTPSYISPEQIHMKNLGPWSDVYSLGCILYEMIAGEPPFDGAPMLLLSKHAFGEPVPPSRRNADVFVPRSLEALVMQMLSKRPAERPSAAATRAAVEQLAQTLGERERSRGAGALVERAARMVDAPAPSEPPAPVGHAAGDAQVVAVTAAMDEAVTIGLRVDGLAPLVVSSMEEIPAHAVAVLVPQGDAAIVTQLSILGRPVIAGADTSDAAHVQTLLNAGAADVVSLPLRVEQIARKVKRAVRKAKRRKR